MMEKEEEEVAEVIALQSKVDFGPELQDLLNIQDLAPSSKYRYSLDCYEATLENTLAIQVVPNKF